MIAEAYLQPQTKMKSEVGERAYVSGVHAVRFLVFVLSSLLLSSLTRTWYPGRRVRPQRSSGRPAVAAVVSVPPRCVPSMFCRA